MKKVAVLVVLSISLFATASAQAAFEGGGKSPSKAPTIEWGQRYAAQLTNHAEEANFGGDYEVAFWRLPPVSTRDELVVNWQSVPSKSNPGYFPVCMTLAQGANDNNWGERFKGGGCSSDDEFELSGSGTAASKVTIQESDLSGNSYLEFWISAGQEASSHYLETFEYSFAVEKPRHYLNMALSPFEEVSSNGIVNASVTRADGSAAPDGLTFGLTVRWNEGGIATYSATSAGGHVAFQLALPESAYKKSALFVGGRGADGEYQAIETPALRARVTEPPPPPPSPTPPKTRPLISSACKKARAKAHVLARQHHRLAKNTRQARGVRRVRLHRRTRKIGSKLQKARTKAATACA